MHPDDAPPPTIHREPDPFFNLRIPRGRLVLIIVGIATLVALCAVVTALSAVSPDHGRALALGSHDQREES